jgi:hypothetical protein
MDRSIDHGLLQRTANIDVQVLLRHLLTHSTALCPSLKEVVLTKHRTWLSGAIRKVSTPRDRQNKRVP